MEANITFWSQTAAFPVLSALTLVPLATLIAICCSRSKTALTGYAFAGAILTVLLSIHLLLVVDTAKSGVQLAEQLKFGWFTYSLGVDSANILFIPLTAVLTLLALIYTMITRHAGDRLFIACLLGYETILMGAITSLNLMQFWLWSVLELLPVVVLTLHAGTGQNRHKIVALLLRYWGSGLLMLLCAFLLIGFNLADSASGLTFDWMAVRANEANLANPALIFVLLFFGFAIRMPLFPFHGWLPVLAERGTVASAAIFIVGLKLGVYGLIRFILPIVPEAAQQWAVFATILGLISIFYGALLALMQINIRRLLSYAVVSHTGMIVIGIFSFSEFGREGSLLLSIAYGLATAGMLFSVGLIYERTRTASIPRLGGLFDTNISIGLLYLISALTTMVMPGTPGYDAAHLLLESVIEMDGWLLAIAILIGNVLAGAFLLRAFQQIFITNPRRVYRLRIASPNHASQELIIALVICLLLIVTGFFTTPVLNFID